MQSETNPGLVQFLHKVLSARETLIEDSDESLNAIEARLGTSKGHMTSLIRLSYLSPEIIRDILAGRQPLGLGAKRLTGLSKELPLDWLAQLTCRGFDCG